MGRSRSALGRLVTPVVLVALVLLATARSAPARAGGTVLYDGAVGGETMTHQGFFYLSQPLASAAVVRYADGGTLLDTTAAIGDLAGFFARADRVPALSRAEGFTLQLTARVISETHTVADRAGLSVLLLAGDARGIELGLWADEIWAQNDGEALFTHGEGARLDLSSRPVALSLTVRGDRYELLADGARVLEGPVRDYRAAEAPIYRVPHTLFLGDNTSRAAAVAHIGFVALTAGAPDPPPTASPSPTPTGTPTTAPTASPTATPSPTTGPAERSRRVFLPLAAR